MENIFTEEDYNQIKNKGISIEKIEKQLYFYRNGIPKINLHQAATTENGILQLLPNEKASLIELFDAKKIWRTHK